MHERRMLIKSGVYLKNLAILGDNEGNIVLKSILARPGGIWYQIIVVNKIISPQSD